MIEAKQKTKQKEYGVTQSVEFRNSDPTDIEPMELVRRIRDGDTDAEGLLIRKYSMPLLTLMRCRVKDRELINDLHQDTFRVVIERLRGRGLDNPSKLASFINKTAINLHIGNARKEARRRTAPNTDVAHAKVDNVVGPLHQVLAKEGSNAVTALLHEMPNPRDEDILRRFYIREEEKASICSSLELSPAHFDRVISRARKRFRQIIELKAPDLANW